MQTQSVEFYSNINPLVGLSAKTLRLYCALEVFRGKSDSLEEPEWFRTPNRDEMLEKVGFSKTEIDKGITELIDAELLQIQDRNSDQWYCLK
jgi:hypothetical protein